MDVVNFQNIFNIHLFTWVMTNQKPCCIFFPNEYNNGNSLFEVYSTFEEFGIASEVKSHMAAHKNILIHKDKKFYYEMA